jgi:hypothetical protein
MTKYVGVNYRRKRCCDIYCYDINCALVGYNKNLKNHGKQSYCGQNILTEDVFVGTQLCSDAGISVRRTVWATTNCCFVSEI